MSGGPIGLAMSLQPICGRAGKFQVLLGRAGEKLACRGLASTKRPRAGARWLGVGRARARARARPAADSSGISIAACAQGCAKRVRGLGTRYWGCGGTEKRTAQKTSGRSVTAEYAVSHCFICLIFARRNMSENLDACRGAH